MNPAIGRCLCGDIQFSAQLPSKWVAHCHCTMCQRSSGAAFVTWVGLDADHCTVDDPDHRLIVDGAGDEGAITELGRRQVEVLRQMACVQFDICAG